MDAGALFDQFVAASNFKNIQQLFHQICTILDIDTIDSSTLYDSLRSRLTSWKAQKLWALLDKRAAQKEYCKQKACNRVNVLIIGAGPCGLRAAIECALLGARCIVVERRDRFSRHNVLHIWPFVIQDLKNLGAKIFYPKFCAGAIDHISIRQLQCILLKVALVVGVQVHDSVAFKQLTFPEPDADGRVPGWRATFEPDGHLLDNYEFDVLIGADGKRNTLPDFPRKEMRGKLAIGITANFVNRRSQAEEKVPEISGVAFIFNQQFFKTMTAQTGIDLENIVYYKDETHYFVMCAKKQSLLEKGVILRDYEDISQLLAAENVDQDRLRSYAAEAADFATEGRLPHVEYSLNHFNQSDVAMFDFTSLFSAACSVRLMERHGRHLLMSIVGDSLHEPFWPTGSGCARGFLGVFDAVWMLRSYGLNKQGPMEMIAERESVYRLLAQTTPDNLQKQIQKYTIDPRTRYQSLEMAIRTDQVAHLVDTDRPRMVATNEALSLRSSVSIRNQLEMPFWKRYRLLRFCQHALAPAKIRVINFDRCWTDGRALSVLLHRHNLLNDSSMAGTVIEDKRSLIQACMESIKIACDIDPPCSPGLWPPSKPALIEYLQKLMDALTCDRKRICAAMQSTIKTPNSGHKRKAPVDASRGQKSEPIRQRTETLLNSLSSTCVNGGIIADENTAAENVALDDAEVAGYLNGHRRRDEDVDQRHAKRLKDLCGVNHLSMKEEEEEKKWTKRPLVEKLNPERVYQVEKIVTGEREQQKIRELYREKQRRADLFTRKMDPRDLHEMEQKLEDTVMGLLVNKDQFRNMSTKEEKILRLSAVDARKHANDGFINHAEIAKYKDIDEKIHQAEIRLRHQQLAGIDIVTRLKEQQQLQNGHLNGGGINGKHGGINGGETPARPLKPLPPLPATRVSKQQNDGGGEIVEAVNHDEQENMIAFRHKATVSPMPAAPDATPRRPLSMSVIESSSISSHSSSVYDSVNARRQQMCRLCQRVVYLAEQLQVEGMFIHKKCFRCAFCGQALRLGHCAQDRNLEQYNPRFYCMQHLNLPLKEKIARIERELRGKTSSNETSPTNQQPPPPLRQAIPTPSPPVPRSRTTLNSAVPVAVLEQQHLRTTITNLNSPDMLAAKTRERMQLSKEGANMMTVESPSVATLTRTPERAEFECYGREIRRLEQPSRQHSSEDDVVLAEASGEDGEREALNCTNPSQNNSTDSDRSDMNEEERAGSPTSSDDEPDLSDGEIEELETTVLNNINKNDDMLSSAQAANLLNNWKRRRSTAMTPQNGDRSVYFTPSNNHQLNTSGESASASSNDVYETPKAVPIHGREGRSWSDADGGEGQDVVTIRERKLKEMALFREQARLRARMKSDDELANGNGDRRSVPCEFSLLPLAEVRPVVVQRELSQQRNISDDRVGATSLSDNATSPMEDNKARTHSPARAQRHAVPFPSVLGNGSPPTPVMAPPPWASPPTVGNHIGTINSAGATTIVVTQKSPNAAVVPTPPSPSNQGGRGGLLARLFDSSSRRRSAETGDAGGDVSRSQTQCDDAASSTINGGYVTCDSQKETSILGKFRKLRTRKSPEKLSSDHDFHSPQTVAVNGKRHEQNSHEATDGSGTQHQHRSPRSRSTPNKHTLSSMSFNGDLRRPNDIMAKFFPPTPPTEDPTKAKSPPITEKDIRRVQRVAERLIRQREQNRQRTAQDIVRRMQETEVRRAEVVEVGRDLEKRLVDDPCNRWVLEQWLLFVAEMQQLERLEGDLRNRMREMELEERHRRLQNQFHAMIQNQQQYDDGPIPRSGSQLPLEKDLLQQLLEVVQERDRLQGEIERCCSRDDRKQDSMALQKILADKGHSYRHFDPVFLRADDV